MNVNKPHDIVSSEELEKLVKEGKAKREDYVDLSDDDAAELLAKNMEDRSDWLRKHLGKEDPIAKQLEELDRKQKE
jgi:DNA-directed RNA polymerase subunit H (RpoH/RPB5)